MLQPFQFNLLNSEIKRASIKFQNIPKNQVSPCSYMIYSSMFPKTENHLITYIRLQPEIRLIVLNEQN